VLVPRDRFSRWTSIAGAVGVVAYVGGLAVGREYASDVIGSRQSVLALVSLGGAVAVSFASAAAVWTTVTRRWTHWAIYPVVGATAVLVAAAVFLGAIHWPRFVSL
jgi:hypothetical protein